MVYYRYYLYINVCYMESEGQGFKEMLDNEVPHGEHEEKPNKKYKTLETKNETINISSEGNILEFTPDEQVLYTSLKGKEMTTIVLGKSKDSSNPGLILKDTNSSKVFAVNAESVAKRVRKLNTDNHSGPLENAMEDPTEKSEEEKIHEQSPIQETPKAKKNGREKINSLPLELKLDKEILALIAEWKEDQGKKTKLLTAGLETAQFLHWILQEKEGVVSKKNYEKIYKLYDNETDPEIKSQAQEAYIEEQEQKEREGEKVIEKPPTEKIVKIRKDGREKINFLPLEVSLNKELKPFITEWKQKQEKKTLLFSKTEASELLDWILKEKATDISVKEYNKLQETYLDLTTDIRSEAKEKDIESQKKEQQQKDEEGINMAREKIHQVVMNENTDLNEIQKQLELHRQEIQKNFGISFDEFNTPATPADDEKIEKLLALSEKETETKKTFWGKIKNIFSSNEDTRKAQNFKKDLDDYLRITKELPDKVQIKTTGGTIGRSMIRERGLVGTSNGSIETARHTPLKRGRPPKTKV